MMRSFGPVAGLVLVLVLAIAGCGAGADSVQPANSAAGSSAAASPRAAATATALESSPAAEPVDLTTVKPMGTAQFWTLIASSAVGTDGDADLQADHLEAALRMLPTAQVAAFQYRLVTSSKAIYSWRYSAAGDLLCGSLGDDGFTDFRSWVISRGQPVYDAFVADPDTLAAVADQFECPGAELFGDAASSAYHDRTGHNSWDDGLPILEFDTALAGYGPIPPEQAAAMFPRLAAAALAGTN
jgi:hypothetical protein